MAHVREYPHERSCGRPSSRTNFSFRDRTFFFFASRVEPGIRVSPQQGGGGGFKTGIRVKSGIRVSEDGGGSEILYLQFKELFFFPCPCLTPIVSDIQYDLNEEKVQKVAKNMR